MQILYIVKLFSPKKYILEPFLTDFLFGVLMESKYLYKRRLLTFLCLKSCIHTWKHLSTLSDKYLQNISFISFILVHFDTCPTHLMHCDPELLKTKTWTRFLLWTFPSFKSACWLISVCLADINLDRKVKSWRTGGSHPHSLKCGAVNWVTSADKDLLFLRRHFDLSQEKKDRRHKSGSSGFGCTNNWYYFFTPMLLKVNMSALTLTHIILLLEVHSPPCFTLERHRWIKWDIKGENWRILLQVSQHKSNRPVMDRSLELQAQREYSVYLFINCFYFCPLFINF